MSKNDKQDEPSPTLRFPEFRKSGPFHYKPLSKLAGPVTERVGQATVTPYTITGGEGLISQEEKLGRTIAGKSLKNYYRLRLGDFAFNKSATKANPEGYIARLHDDVDAAVPNSIFTCFRRSSEEADGDYLDWLFQANLHGKWLRKFITVGARAHGALQVSDDDLFACPVPLPPDPAEQKKIAACLGSLDDLIAAEGRKLAALRRHTTGLMQQLFPRHGESQPRMRFPEFQKAGGWEVGPLKKIAENLDSKRVPITANDREPGDVPYYGASGIVDHIKDHLFAEDLLCVSEDGANLLARTYPIAFSISGKTWVNNHAHVLRFEERRTQTIVASYLNLIDLGDFITGIAQPKLNRANLDIIPVPLPGDKEQQRVADFLDSLDTRLAAHASRLEALLQHKRGLMQQLFPVLEGGGK